MKMAMFAPLLVLLATPVPVAAEADPAPVVQKSFDLYRARNLDGFAQMFAADALLVYNGIQIRGREQIKASYSLNFAPGAPKVTVLDSGMMDGNLWVETSYTFADGSELCCALSVYTIQNGKIAYLEVTAPELG